MDDVADKAAEENFGWGAVASGAEATKSPGSGQMHYDVFSDTDSGDDPSGQGRLGSLLCRTCCRDAPDATTFTQCWFGNDYTQK